MKLYRYISFEEFVNLLTTKAMHYSCPTKWEDTYEGYMFRSLDDVSHRTELLKRMWNEIPSNIPDFEKALSILKNYCKIAYARYHWYGQCWTREANENDAFWRIYSYGKRSIRISTTDDSLWELFPTDNYYRAKKSIQYDAASGKEFLNIQFDATLQTKSTNECFFHKRIAFEHEKEYRILVSPKGENNSLGIIYNMSRLALHLKWNEIHPDSMEDCIHILLDVLQTTVVDAVTMGHQAEGIDVAVHNLESFVESVLVHPMAADWYTKLVEQLCAQHNLPFNGQSTLYKN